jgi:PAS domain S-box-containing protein
MVEDITARKEAEEKLRFSELRFRSIWQKSFEGMRLTDEQGIILAVNPAFCQIVGMPAEELVGRPYTAIYALRRRGRDDAEVSEAFCGKKD